MVNKILYPIKKKIIMDNLAKKKKNNPFDLIKSETFKLSPTDDESINNSYFFTAHNNDGDSIVIRLGLRNNKDSEMFFFYKHNGIFLTHINELYKKDECPVKVTCVEPGKIFDVSFDGLLKEYDNDKTHKCELKARFSATNNIFDFFYNSSSEGMAKSIASHKWSKEYFKEVGGASQTHYEQTGVFTGEMTVDGEKNQFNLVCVRDHSFGPRNWDYMDDHIWVCGMTDEGKVVNFSFVNYPAMKKVYLGYTNFFSEDNMAVKDYKLIDYKINDGIGPDKSEIKLIFPNKQTLNLVIKRDANLPIHFDNGKYVFQEGIGEIEINGIKSRGTIEYGFNQDPKRWNY